MEKPAPPVHFHKAGTPLCPRACGAKLGQASGLPKSVTCIPCRDTEAFKQEVAAMEKAEREYRTRHLPGSLVQPPPNTEP